jgi:hypothetical protein
MPGFFRIAKSVFSKVGNSFGEWKILFGRKLRGLRKLIQAKQRFPLNLACIKLATPTAVPPATNVVQPTHQAGASRLPKRD